MAKRHKSKGNQQKPHNRKTFRNSNGFSRDSSGPSTPYFSMKDEVMNTERHHSEWSPSVRLRHQAISFVSAGSIDPLKEAKKDLAEQELNVQVQEEAEDLDGDLENSDGALAQMNIDSPPSDIQINLLSKDTQPLQSDLDEKEILPQSADTPQDLFMVDSVGDRSLAPKGPPPVILNRTPEQLDGSEDEVIVFKGRREQVVVKDDPPIAHTQTTEPRIQQVSTLTDLSTKHGLGGPRDDGSDTSERPTGRRVYQGKGTEPDVTNDSIASSLQAAGLNAASALHLSKIMPGNFKGGKTPFGVSESVDRQSRPLSKRERKKTSGRRQPRTGKAKGINAVFNAIQQYGDDDDEMDDELYRDYIENMSGNEEILALTQPDGDDEWVSSEMDEADRVEDTNIVVGGEGRVINRGQPDTAEASSTPFTELEMTDGDTFLSNVDDEDDDDDEGGDEDEDDYDEEDEDGTSDPGDDSDLESDLDYTAQERWEDEVDLRQRQIDAMTDEEIARILAKQEDLGIGSDEILLLDDSGFGDVSRAQAGLDAILSNPSHPNRRRSKKGRKSDHFPSASLMADVLEQDPYGGFDVMDFDRPSLRNNTKGGKGRKSAGPLPEELAGLSDSDLIEDLQSAWSNDRAKKAAKRAEREELRAQGMLPGAGRSKKGNKFKPDLAARFSEGMTLNQLRNEIEEFLDNDENTTKAFPPMEKKERKLLHEIANVFDLTSNSRGSGKNRFTIMSKRARTPDFDPLRWERVLRFADRGFVKAAGKGRAGKGASTMPYRAGRGGGFSKAAVGYANGEVVGAAAPEIAESSFGRKLMEKMGWEKGMALGKGGEGMLLPVEARVKSGRGGLG